MLLGMSSIASRRLYTMVWAYPGLHLSWFNGLDMQHQEEDIDKNIEWPESG